MMKPAAAVHNLNLNHCAQKRFWPVSSDRMHSMTTLDPLDARILLALDDDPDVSMLELARVLGISRNTVHARLQRLTREGVFLGFSQRISPASLGYPVVGDLLAGFQGPLAGIATAMAVAETPWILTLPCDGPYPPADLAQRLALSLIHI